MACTTTDDLTIYGPDCSGWYSDYENESDGLQVGYEDGDPDAPSGLFSRSYRGAGWYGHDDTGTHPIYWVDDALDYRILTYQIGETPMYLGDWDQPWFRA